MSTITGLWFDKQRTAIIDGNKVEVVSSFALTERFEALTHREANVSLAGSTVVLYRLPTDPTLCMFRWDNGVDLPLDTNDVVEAKNAVETMLKMEGMSYVKA